MSKYRNFVILVLAAVMLAAAAAVSAADDHWTARYWNNTALGGDPVLVRSESELDHEWGDDSPAAGINSDNFSARWTRHVYFNAGTYRFVATTDDGMRVYVDDQLIIDSWYDSQSHTVAADIYLSAGDHRIKVEYYEAGGGAVAKLTWGLAATVSPAPLTETAPAPAAGPGNWRAEFYNNIDLTGEPVWVRADEAINFIWGSSSPVPNVVNADGFSVRWTGTLNLTPGQYYFTVAVDGGVRVSVNGQPVIDRWDFNWEVKQYTGVIDLAGGSVPVQVEYFEDAGLAEMRLSWNRVGAATAPATAPPATAVQPDVPGGTPAATMTGAQALTIRSGPGLDFEAIGYLTQGQTVTLTGYRDYGGFWIEIILPGGGSGWVSASYMTGNVDFMTLAVKGV